MRPTFVQLIGTIIFAIAIFHTFSTTFFEHLASKRPRHAGVWRLLGEVEVVFGFWAFILMLLVFLIEGEDVAVNYLDSCNFTEPLFVFVIMAVLAPIAATLIQMAISRSREYLADATGARLSGTPLALAGALAKLDAAARQIPMAASPFKVVSSQ